MGSVPSPNATEQQIDAALETLATSSTHDQDESHAAIRLLARSSKENIEVREKLVNSATLGTLIASVADPAQDLAVSDAALRCIGNACADNDEARGLVLENGLSWMSTCMQRFLELHNEEISLLAIKVLYNMCSDFEPMQKRCYEDKLHYDIIAHLASLEEAETPEIAFAGDLLLWISGQKEACEPTMASFIKIDLVKSIVQFPCTYADVDDLDQFATFVEIALVFLRDTKIQEQILHEKLMSAVWDILNTHDDLVSSLDETDEDQIDDVKHLVSLETNVTWVLSDLAAHSDFAKNYSLDDDWVCLLVDLIKAKGTVSESVPDPDVPTSTRDNTLTAACQIFGNLLWSLSADEAAAAVQRLALYSYVYQIIIGSSQKPASSGLLHSAAGLLIQISRPSMSIREQMGQIKTAIPALEILCRNSTTQVKQEGARLLRALGKDCPANQERFGSLATEVVLSLSESAKQEEQPDHSKLQAPPS